MALLEFLFSMTPFLLLVDLFLFRCTFLMGFLLLEGLLEVAVIREGGEEEGDRSGEEADIGTDGSSGTDINGDNDDEEEEIEADLDARGGGFPFGKSRLWTAMTILLVTSSIFFPSWTHFFKTSNQTACLTRGSDPDVFKARQTLCRSGKGICVFLVMGKLAFKAKTKSV